MFFLSYAHTDDVGGFVRGFYSDLCLELVRKTGVDQAAIGFLDHDMASGTVWPDELADRLGTCQVFVPLYSPSYFGSENCGKEWQVFAGRLDALRRVDGAGPALVVPLLWEPLATLDLPAAVEPYHFRGLGPEYTELGLMKIVKNQRDLALVYDRILAAIAIEIKAAIARPPLPATESRPKWSTTKNAFQPVAPRPSGPTAAPASPAGPRHVHLVVVAGTAAELRRAHDPAPYYGSRPTDWAPFAPEHPEPLVRAAAAIVIEQRMTPYPEQLDEKIIQRLDAAQRDNELVLLLVDPRTAAVPAHAAALRDYDDRLYTITGVVVAWNLADAGSGPLATAVREALPKKILLMGGTVHASARTVHEAVHSMEEFRRVLMGLLVFLQEIFLSVGEAMRAVMDGQAGSFATVTGTVHA